MRGPERQFRILLAGMMLQFAAAALVFGAPQSGRPDDAKRPASRPARGKSSKPKVKAEVLPPANVLIKVEPEDSIVTFDNEPVSAESITGTLALKDLKVGPHVVVARREGYREQTLTMDLAPGDNQSLDLKLQALPAILNVSPVVSGAQIEVRTAGAEEALENRTGSIRNLALPPGKYKVSVSKDQYRTEERTIILNPGQAVYLEPMLERVIKEVGAPVAPVPARQTIVAVPQSSSVVIEGKSLLVTLFGASGNSAVAAGTVSVAVAWGSNTAEISGVITGAPCRIEFVRLENVAESSVAEAPGPSNKWSRMVIRVRPKDAKRTVRFNINWTALAAARVRRDGPANSLGGQ